MAKGIIFDWVETLSEGSRKLFPKSEEVLRECKSRGYVLGLISLAGHGIRNRQDDISATGITKYFGCIIIDTQKTSDHYIQCMEKLGIKPTHTLIVDDRTLRGISIGNTLGCKTCWIKRPKYAHEAPNKETGEPTYIIHSIEELLTII